MGAYVSREPASKFLTPFAGKLPELLSIHAPVKEGSCQLCPPELPEPVLRTSLELRRTWRITSPLLVIYIWEHEES